MNHFSAITAQLEGSGVDAILLTSEANRFYASAFHTMAEEDAVVFIAKSKSYVITDSRYIEAAEKEVKDAEVCLRNNTKNYEAWLKELAEANGVKVIGFESKGMSVYEYENYSKALGCEFKDISSVLSKLRESKDADEVESLKKAQAIAETALTQLLEEIKVGMTEKEIAAKLMYLLLANGGEKMSFEPIVASGPNSSLPHAIPTDRKIQPGDFLTIDYGCVYNGYCSDTTRTVAIGYATEEMEKVYNTVLEAQMAGIAMAKAGVVGAEVHEAAHEVIRKAGYGEYFGHGFGHSLGIEIHEEPRFSPVNKGVMPAGAAVSAEPGIYLPGKFGVRIEDVIILTEDGCEDITKLPKTLRILPV